MDQNYYPVPTPPMTFQEAVKKAFDNYCNFSGRATRAEYWWFFLFQFIVGFVLGLLGFASSVFSIIGNLVSLALLLPSLGLAWRRMHDIGKGGGWFFINFIPLVGNIIWIVWCCQPSEPTANRFGDVPANA